MTALKIGLGTRFSLVVFHLRGVIGPLFEAVWHMVAEARWSKR